MSHLLPFLLVAATGLATQAAMAATVPAATASTTVVAGSSVVLDGRDQINTQAFGTHRAVYSGGQAQASVSLGANSDSIPFIAFSAGASGRSFADLSGQLIYYWVVQGAPGSSELVPVTITSLGRISAQVTAQAVDPNLRANASANWLGMLASNTFETWSTGGRQDVRTYGVNSGNRSGPNPVSFTDPGPSAPGGSVTASGEASFSKTFTMMVYPNVANRIVMQVSAGVGNSTLYNSSDPVFSWNLSGYLDPVITIDPSYVDRFSVLQSDIPMVPVPEPTTLATLLVGLGVLASMRRRGFNT